LKFGDKEIQDNEFGDGTGLEWYDFGARLYDVQIGRWMVPDAAAEESLAWTPYRYGFDNPVCYIDPDGNSESVADMVKKAWNATPDDGASSFTMQDGELQEQPDPEVNRIRMRYRDMIATASKKGIIWRQITCSILLMVAAKQ
jgi:RHS repeat-associated protein